MRILVILLLIFFSGVSFSQSDSLKLITNSKAKDNLIVKLNEDGTQYFQVVFLNQVWLRYNESNLGTTVMGKEVLETIDIGLRRTRIQLYGQITDRSFLYFQFGQNNVNAMYASNPAGNRKVAAFFHDAVAEYRLTKKNQLKVGGGLTIANGLSRFSQPSIGTIMTLDVPVFAQATVDQTDLFSRKLSIYARGQISKFDYRFSLSDPFPVNSNGSTPPPLSANSNFATTGHHKQYQGYLMYQFFEHEGHTTPYMTGTYLGKKKVFNVAGGIINQKAALWHRELNGDTTFTDMTLWCVESFLDMPVNKEKGTAISAYAGYFTMNYGKNYLRYNGIMNPANGTVATNSLASNAYGNAFPMFGTGNVLYMQLGYLLGKKLISEKNGQLMPFVSLMSASFQKLNGNQMNVIDIGMNWFQNGHKSKVSIDYQLRPTFYIDNTNNPQPSKYNSCIILQYQIMI